MKLSLMAEIWEGINAILQFSLKMIIFALLIINLDNKSEFSVTRISPAVIR